MQERKEQAMNALKEKRFIEDITKLQNSAAKKNVILIDKVAERIDRTKGRYPTVNRYYPLFKSLNQQPINRNIFLNLLNFLSN